MNKPKTPLLFLRYWPEDEPDPDLSTLGLDDAPELTDELATPLRPLHEVDPGLADLVRKGGRPLLPDEVRKRRVTLMLDPDVIEHFKAGGRGWQTRMNAALRRAAGL
ncbi:MAG: BrnA antitoxin family protein [Amaricoccus sp.]